MFAESFTDRFAAQHFQCDAIRSVYILFRRVRTRLSPFGQVFVANGRADVAGEVFVGLQPFGGDVGMPTMSLLLCACAAPGSKSAAANIAKIEKSLRMSSSLSFFKPVRSVPRHPTDRGVAPLGAILPDHTCKNNEGGRVIPFGNLGNRPVNRPIIRL